MISIGIVNSEPWLAIALSIVAFGSFSWALQGHFRAGRPMPQGMRILSLVSLLSYMNYVALLAWEGCEVLALTTTGLVAFASSIALFWWAVVTTRRHRLRLAYTDEDPDMLYTAGPFAYVRHPFYLSYMIFWIGAALVAGRWQWAAAVILTLWYFRIAQAEERRFQCSALAMSYHAYRRRTGMLLPRFRLGVA